MRLRALDRGSVRIPLRRPDPRPGFVVVLVVSVLVLVAFGGCASFDEYRCGEGFVVRDGRCVAHINWSLPLHAVKEPRHASR
jgi:hypothetical protein